MKKDGWAQVLPHIKIHSKATEGRTVEKWSMNWSSWGEEQWEGKGNKDAFLNIWKDVPCLIHSERKISIMTSLLFFLTSQWGKNMRQLDDNTVVMSWDIVVEQECNPLSRYGGILTTKWNKKCICLLKCILQIHFQRWQTVTKKIICATWFLIAKGLVTTQCSQRKVWLDKLRYVYPKQQITMQLIIF